MNYKYRSIFLTIFILILILGFIYYFSPLSKRENNTIESAQMTEDQKLGILSKMSSDVPANNISETEKENILNQTDEKNKATSTLSREEILQILNRTN